MIAYGKDDIEHFVAHLNAGKPRDEKKAGEEWSTFNLVHPYPFYSPSNFVRIGLFFLTLFVVLLIFAFLWFIAGTPGSDSALGLLCLIVGSMSMIGLEYFVRKRKHYQSGIDEAFH
ncbi:MAG: hypothetical protein EOO01_06010 [Chitinophagaceae bacterium]|nr:MAG: hypothetical protein EOO01_06010 [Chitinophagaceae bacterium]